MFTGERLTFLQMTTGTGLPAFQAAMHERCEVKYLADRPHLRDLPHLDLDHHGQAS